MNISTHCKTNKYKYIIYYENQQRTKGVITVRNLDEVYKVLCKNRFTQVDNRTKAFYYNSSKINSIEVEKVEEK